jgi:integrative and conjugative element protein (TIGR02256 family)
MFGLPSKAKVARHVFLTAGAYDRIAEISARRRENEIGGVLVGYATVDHALVVVDVSGPGPKGVCARHSVTIDGQYATAFCARASESSDSAVQYLGDWHVHTDHTAEPSPVDFAALRKLPKLNAWGYPIFSLVLSASLKSYTCIFRHGMRVATFECSIIDARMRSPASEITRTSR